MKVAAFPWIFQSPWSVLGLGLVFAAVMRWTRRRGLLAGVHGVERRSEGDLFYLVAVCLLFLVGRGTPVFYLISILVLVVASLLSHLPLLLSVVVEPLPLVPVSLVVTVS